MGWSSVATNSFEMTMKKQLATLLCIAASNVWAAFQPSMVYNPWTTNIPPRAVEGNDNLSITNVGSGTNWMFYGVGPKTVATLSDATNVSSSMIGMGTNFGNLSMSNRFTFIHDTIVYRSMSNTFAYLATSTNAYAEMISPTNAMVNGTAISFSRGGIGNAFNHFFDQGVAFDRLGYWQEDARYYAGNVAFTDLGDQMASFNFCVYSNYTDSIAGDVAKAIASPVDSSDNPTDVCVLEFNRARDIVLAAELGALKGHGTTLTNFIYTQPDYGSGIMSILGRVKSTNLTATGIFSGNGSGLTNLPFTNVTFYGTITGNGAGLTNLNVWNRLRLPNDVLIRGANIGGVNSSYNNAAVQTNWSLLWPTWIAPQMDIISSNGGNAVRFFGVYEALDDGTQTIQQYINNWKQLIEYAATKKLWVVASLGNGGDNGVHHADASTNLVMQAATNLVLALSGYPNVLYFDLLQEANASVANYYPAFGSNLVHNCKQFTTKPLTLSMAPGFSRLTDFTNWVRFGNYDILDIHCYPSDGTNTTVAQIRTAGFNQPISIGEFGQSVDQGTNAMVLWYDYVRGAISDDGNVMGALVWATTDSIGEPDSNNWGLCDSNDVARPAVMAAWQRFPTNRVPVYFSPSGTITAIQYGTVTARQVNLDSGLRIAINDDAYKLGLTMSNNNSGSSAICGILTANNLLDSGGFLITSSGYNGVSERRRTTIFSSGPGLLFKNDSSAASAGTSPMWFQTGGYNNDPTLSITAGNPGNLGVGVTNPAASLHVFGKTNAVLLRASSPAYTNALLVVSNGDAYLSGTLNVTNGSTIISKTITPTNGIIYQSLVTFTNMTITSNNVSLFNLYGTNQLIALPDVTKIQAYQIYRFTSTNGFGSFILTNSGNSTVTIRDGVSLSLKNIGIGEIGVYTDGGAWLLASKAKTIFPNASWSVSTNIFLASSTTTSNYFTFDQLEFNNSQGISLTNGYQFYINNPGQYFFTYSAVLTNAAGADTISVWLQQSGVNVTRSRTDTKLVKGASNELETKVMTVNYILNVSTNLTWFALVGRTSLTGGIYSSAAADGMPAMPGVIVTINRVSDPYP